MDITQILITVAALSICGIGYLLLVGQKNKQKFKEVLSLLSDISKEEKELGTIHFWRGVYDGRKVCIKQTSIPDFHLNPLNFSCSIFVECNAFVDFDLFSQPVWGDNFETRVLNTESRQKTIGVRVPPTPSLTSVLDRWIAKQEVQKPIITLFNDAKVYSITIDKFDEPGHPTISASMRWSNINKDRVLTILNALFKPADTFKSAL